MPLVALFVDAVPSHMYSSMGLARRLASRGYTVEYWGDSRIEPLATQQGFAFRPIGGVWSRYPEEIRLPTGVSGLGLLIRPRVILQKCLVRRAWRNRLPHTLQLFERSLDAALAVARPDFVVFDAFLLAYYPFFRRRDIPAVVLSSKPLATPDPAVPPFSSNVIPSGGVFNRLAIRMSWLAVQAADMVDRVLHAVTRVLRVYTNDDLLREATRRAGISIRHDRVRRWVKPDMHFKSVREWVMWSPASDLPRRKPLSENIFYVGSCVDSGRIESELPFTAPDRRQSVVYVAVGTVRFRWRDNVPFLLRVIEALRDRPDVVVFISTGDERATAALGPPPGNVRVFDFLPQLKMLDLADLVITHAGAGTFREAIAKQVPMLAYPRNHDQMGNAARIVFHRLGLRGRRTSDSAAAIREKTLRILRSQEFRRHLRRLRQADEACREQLLTAALSSLGQPAYAGELTAAAQRHEGAAFERVVVE